MSFLNLATQLKDTVKQGGLDAFSNVSNMFIEDIVNVPALVIVGPTPSGNLSQVQINAGVKAQPLTIPSAENDDEETTDRATDAQGTTSTKKIMGFSVGLLAALAIGAFILLKKGK